VASLVSLMGHDADMSVHSDSVIVTLQTWNTPPGSGVRRYSRVTNLDLDCAKAIDQLMTEDSARIEAMATIEPLVSYVARYLFCLGFSAAAGEHYSRIRRCAAAIDLSLIECGYDSACLAAFGRPYETNEELKAAATKVMAHLPPAI
jgi:hypothetical protein